ncbi:MAG TPA: histidine phosphatase family protein [Dehalococcoidales bacterium]
MRLLLVRHGDTEFNSGHRFMGYSDIELSPDGQHQIERLCDYLVDERIEAAYASDLMRAITTARILTDGRGLVVTPCPELREMNYGVCEGLTFGEINQNYPEVAKQCANFTPSLEFPEGETFRDFSKRVVTFLERLKAHKPSDTILIVSHNGPLKTLVCHYLGIDQQHWWQIRIDTASLSIIDVSPRGAMLSRLNDISYLKKTGKS